LGVRLASIVFGGALFVVSFFAWIGFSDEVRGVFTWPERLTLVGIGVAVVVSLWALSRSKVVATGDRVVVVNGFRRRELEPAQIVAVTLPEGAPWATLDLADGTAVAAMGIQGSDGQRARTAVRELRAVLEGQSA
jgi:hypothetical protein